MTRTLQIVRRHRWRWSIATLLSVACSTHGFPGPTVLDLERFPDFDPDELPAGYVPTVEQGDPVAVYGYVVNDSTHAALFAAQVYAADGHTGTLSGADGRYRVWARPGDHVLVAAFIAHRTDSIRIVVDSVPIRADFSLKSQPLAVSCGSAESIGVEGC